MKIELGREIKAIREERGVSTYELQQKGIHPTMCNNIEQGKGYTIDSMEKYLRAIGDDLVLRVGKKMGKTGVPPEPDHGEQA